MPKCTFCGIPIEKGTGKMFVYATGKVVNFCSNRCEKHLHKLKRKPLTTRWTEAYRREHKKGVAERRVARQIEKKAAQEEVEPKAEQVVE